MSERVVTDTLSPAARRAGVGAFLYALFSLATGVVLGVVLVGLKVAGIDPGLTGVAVDVAVASAVVAVAVGGIQRVAGSGGGRVSVGWIAVWACGVPAVVVAYAVALLLISPS